MTKTIEELEDHISDLEETLHKIQSWCDAYPLDIFPEPNLKKVHEILQEHGMSLDAVSASSMRHVLKGISKIIEEGKT